MFIRKGVKISEGKKIIKLDRSPLFRDQTTTEEPHASNTKLNSSKDSDPELNLLDNECKTVIIDIKQKKFDSQFDITNIRNN